MSIFLDTINNKSNHQHTPVWFMRQVGRYMPQYKELKGSMPLYDFFHNTDSIVSSTLLGPELLDVDAAILFSDILTIFDGFRISYQFSPGPQLSYDPQIPLHFTLSPEETFSFLIDAIKSLKQKLTVPLIGFSASPFTLACYLLEGESSKDYHKTLSFIYAYPEQFTKILSILSDAIVVYLHMQTLAGINSIQLFESTSHRLSNTLFDLYVLEENRKLIQKLRFLNLPIGLFSRCSEYNFLKLFEVGADILNPDFTVNLNNVLSATNRQNITIQGNLDPAALLLPQDKLLNFLDVHSTSIRNDPKYIFNTGHGILPHTPLENVQTVVNYVRNQF